jgi:hypothetical protein
MQATPLRVVLDAEYENSAFEHENSLFGMHLNKCVAIANFQFPVNRKHDKRCELFNNYLHYGTSYAPQTGGFERRVILDAEY